MAAKKSDGHESLTLEACIEALRVVSPADRRTRVRMGEALKDEFGDEAFTAFDAWYSEHDRYTAAESKSAWKSFGKGAVKGSTIATLVYEASRAGFKFNRAHQAERTPEQRAQFEAQRAARRAEQEAAAQLAQDVAAERAAAIWASATPAPADHPYLVRKGIAPHVARAAPEWVKEWTNPETGEVRVYRFPDPLLIPIWSAPGKLASLQAIFPTKCIGPKDEKRDKDYLADGRKQACYCTIGSIKADTETVIVCEGYATGATLHQATTFPVMAAFDAGNLQAVAAMLRGKLPKVRIVVAGDNDQFTTKPGGTKWNPGLEAAKAAVKACDGILAMPKFKDLSTKPTDFNDLAALEGIDAVLAQISAAIEPPAAPAPTPDKLPPVSLVPPDKESIPEDNKHFAILGYDHERYFIFQHGKRQIATITVGNMSEKGLIEHAPLNWWEMTFPGKNGIDTSAAAEFLIRTAEKRGIYDVSRIRGRGAWVDDGRMVYHHGSYLTVDGVPTDITMLKSKFVYELDRSLPDPGEEAMDSDEGERILELAEKFRWTKPGSAALLAGWVALAPLCGALRWRPHIWLTGGAGCGKSTVLNRFVHHLLGGLDLFAQGNSSEAGIRQSLRADALPVLFDESESNEESDIRRIQNVLSLIRQASTESEAQTLKGSAHGDAMAFHIRSMFCLASIQVGIKQQADVERMAVLGLRPKREDHDSAGTWERLEAALYAMERDATLPGRLFKRALELLPITLKNISVFTGAAAHRFNSQRDGDQYGTLLAGAWSLISMGEATREQALEMIDKYDWSEHRENNEMDEGQRALSALLEAHIRVPGGIEVNVYELVCAANGTPTDSFGTEDNKADALLQRHGMKVRDGKLLLSNNSNELRRLVEGTTFAADLRGVLLRVEGADRNDNKPTKFNGVQSKCITIPVDAIVTDDDGKPKAKYKDPF